MRCRLQELSLSLTLALTASAQPFVPGDVTWEDGSRGKVFAGDCVRAK